MTHDELLAKIDTPNELHVPNADGTTKMYKLKSQHMKALRTVVELHKPVLDTFLHGLELDPPEVTGRQECEWCESTYPCPVIQALEKELG